MLRYFLDKVMGGFRLFKPIVMVTVPYGVTSVERRAVHEAAIQAGAREARLIPAPLAAAIGAGLPVDTPTGNLIVDIGGGTTEAAVVAMNGIVAARCGQACSLTRPSSTTRARSNHHRRADEDQHRAATDIGEEMRWTSRP